MKLFTFAHVGTTSVEKCRQIRLGPIAQLLAATTFGQGQHSCRIRASFLGDKRWNDKLDDLSQEAVDKDLRETKRFLARFESIDTSGFPDQETPQQNSDGS